MTCLVSMPSLMIFSATCARHRLELLGQEHGAEAALAEGLQQLVAADHGAGLLEGVYL